MPTNKKPHFPLRAEYIEAIHDEGILLSWPGIEPVRRKDCLDRNLLHSAAAQPFQGGFGIEYFYPTLYDKAACLFFSIAGGHIFGNGNKRTAVLALDQFLTANSIYLLLPNTEMYNLALQTATYRTRQEKPEQVMALISKRLQENSVEFVRIKSVNLSLYKQLHRVRRLIRRANLPSEMPRCQS